MRNAVMGIYLAAVYGLTGLALIRQADQLPADEQPVVTDGHVGEPSTKS
ncbi:MAG: hypothetical protein M3445_01055 [Actinomycetota bacterium]|nr:hypothetical protein [Actinomycetota bacterium]